MATIFWTLEMLSSFSTAYHKEDSLLVTNRCLIALRHLRTWFIVDALTLGPDYLERLSRAGLLDDATSDLGLGAPHMLRLVRGGRFLRLFRLLRMLRLAKIRKFHGEISGKISVELAHYAEWLPGPKIRNTNIVAISCYFIFVFRARSRLCRRRSLQVNTKCI